MREGTMSDISRIDWGDLQPTVDVRAAVEARIAPLSHRDRVALRRRGSGFEAQVRTLLPGRSTLLRLHGESLTDVVERTAELLAIVASETARQQGVAPH